MQRRTFTCAAASLLGVPGLVPSLARAATVPITGPVRIVVGFAPGGGTDILARVVGEKLAAKWGVAVVVENKPGATGTLAADFVAKAPPDGTTLLMAHANSHAIAPWLLNNVRYDPRKDFSPIALVGVTPNLLTCHEQQAVRTVPAILERCRKEPGHVTFGSSGVGSAQHLAFEMMKLAAKIDAVHVPYRGSGALIVDLLGGQVDYAFDTMTAATPFVKQGKVIAIAQTRLQRSKAHPTVPTLAELGFEGLDAASWYGLVGPKGLSPSLVERMNSDVNQVLALPDVARRLEEAGAEDAGGSAAKFAEYISTEYQKWGQVIKSANVRIES